MVQLSSFSTLESFVGSIEPGKFIQLHPATLQKSLRVLTATTKNNNLLLTDKEAAPLLGVAAATLRSWRCRGIGPAYVKFAGLRGGVRYDVRDIAEFRERCRHTPLVRAAFEGK
jgi:hypothetical protein